MNHLLVRHSFLLACFALLVSGGILGAHLVSADQQLESDANECDANANGGVCNDQRPQERHSKLCHSSQHSQKSLSPIKHLYNQGISAQAYKPNAPIKTDVCNVVSTQSRDEDSVQPHTVAHWPLWRSKYHDVVPMIVHGNIYSCGSPSSLPASASSYGDAIRMEVWQPRPDGSYSSLRTGVEEGECRASVPTTDAESEFSNFLGRVQYETLAPGSSGIFGGLVPPSFRDYPPYGPGSINMHLNIEGYEPWIGRLDTSELEEWMLQKDSHGRFRFKGWDMRPHATRVTNYDGFGGIEIQSVKKVSRPGYDLALEVEIDVFLTPVDGNETADDDTIKPTSSLDGAFCSTGYLFSWIPAFFKEPIAICFPSLLDFFAL